MIVAGFLVALFVLCQVSASLMGITTMVVSFLVFAKIEADQNVYDLRFWFTRYPGARLLWWFRAFGKLESVVRALLLGLLAWFTFAGKDGSRILSSCCSRLRCSCSRCRS